VNIELAGALIWSAATGPRSPKRSINGTKHRLIFENVPDYLPALM
jgi:hypothetical protein